MKTTALMTLVAGLAATLAAGALTAAEDDAARHREMCAKKAAAGDSMTIAGKDGWLFLRNELRHIGAGPFWGENAATVSKATSPDKADPLPAILDFNGQLKSRGIELILAPVPCKALVYPEKIDAPVAERLDTVHQEFFKLLGDKGVKVLDLAEVFLKEKAKPGSPGLYCKTDSHWSPYACEVAARQIKKMLGAPAWLKGKPDRFTTRQETRVISGDLTDDKGSEELPARIVHGPADALEDRASPILLLGDSHTLVFHAGADLQGTGAGLADQLAAELGAAVDVIGVRGSGAMPARVNLMRRVKAAPAYLAGKKVIIWCFAEREFTEGAGWSVFNWAGKEIMVFSSYLFIYYFLPLALAVYYLIARAGNRALNYSLILFGYVFYGWANPKFIFLMAGTTLVDWLASMVIGHGTWRLWKVWHEPLEALPRDSARNRPQRWAIVLSIVSNLISLGFFKYFNFGVESYNDLVAALGWSQAQWEGVFRVVLPLGISFYTFQSLSYTIDVYRGDAKAMKHFGDFACFVSMYPHLVAGPILQFSFLAEQIENRRLTLDKFARGAAMFSLGLGKKILLANACGKIADTVFNAGSARPLDAWYGLAAYAFQIYYDFSGYSDMAIGLGLMLGLIFAKNFDSPYKSESLTEFWRRWHISLSSWLRDYLYVPLGGSRYGEARTYINLILVMLLGGLWHGASWNFIIWGGIHGSWLAAERIMGKKSFYAALPRVLRVGVTFAIVCLAWVFFRAPDLPSAVQFLGNLLGWGDSPAAGLLAGSIRQPYYLLCFVAAGLSVWTMPQSWDITRRVTWPKVAWVCAVLVVSLTLLFAQSYNPFIYFIF